MDAAATDKKREGTTLARTWKEALMSSGSAAFQYLRNEKFLRIFSLFLLILIISLVEQVSKLSRLRFISGIHTVPTFQFTRLLIGIAVLSLGLLFLLLWLLRVSWFLNYLSKIKEKIRLLIIPKTQDLQGRFARFREEFKGASPKQKLRLLRIPIVIVVLLILVSVFGQYFAPPRVVVTFPGDSGTDIPLDSRIEIEFDREMIRHSVEVSISFSPKIQGDFSWVGKRKLIFSPQVQLERSKTYSVIIRGSALSRMLVPKLRTDRFSFTTLGNPRVLLATPQTEAPSTMTPVTVMFDRAMIPITTATESASQLPAFELSPSVKGEGRWLGTTVYQFRPSEDFVPATTYTYRVEAGLRSMDGAQLAETEVFSFSTPMPRVIWTSPTNTYEFASPTASVSAALNLPIDSTSAAEHLHIYSMLEGVREEVPGKVKVSGPELGFYPTQPLKRESFYQAVLERGLLSTQGPNGLEVDYSWMFRVSPMPKVIGSTPQNGNENVKEEHRLSIKFISPMDEKSFKGNVFITPVPGKEPTLYFSSYRGDNSLSIGTYLSRLTVYTVSVSGNVRDQYGVPLGQDYNFSFTTAAYDPSISIVPSRTYFASFNQYVVPRIVVKVVNVNSVNYRLFRISKEDFLDLYRRRKTYRSQDPGYSNWQSYDPSRLPLVRSWSETFESDQNIFVHVITKVELPSGERIPPGMYFLEASIDNQRRDNLVMLVSRSAMTFKRSEEQGLVWAVDQGTGEVVHDMNISLVSEDGSEFDRGKTNTDGVFISTEDYRSLSNEYGNKVKSLFAFGDLSDEQAVVIDDWSEGIRSYDFGLKSYYDEHEIWNAKHEFKMYLMLDRPIYRPGQTVYFKGMIRADNDGLYSLPSEGAKVMVSVKDPKQQMVFTNEIPVTSLGTFSSEFVVSPEGSVGSYFINAAYSGDSFQQGFQVEEYRRPDFAVEVSSGRNDYTSGDSLLFDVNANFYFGAPVDKAPIRWTLTTQDNPFRWDKDLTFEFGDSDSYWFKPWWFYSKDYWYSGEKVAEGTGKTDAKGNYQVKIPTNIADKTTNQLIRLEAIVTDETNLAIADSRNVTIHKGAVHIGIKPEYYSNQKDKEARVELVTVDIDGNELKNVPLSVSFFKRSWDYVKEKNPDDGEFYFVSKPSDTLVATTPTVTNDLGRAKVGFIPSEGGSYRAVAETTDNLGNSIKSATYIWVSGSGRSVRRENHDRIVLVPDKQEYGIGESASVYADVPFEKARGLVTVERGSVFSYQVVETTSDNQTFRVPIEERYAPNVYISATFVKPGTDVKNPTEFKMGITEIRVKDPRHRVELNLKPDKDRYSPGEAMKASITAQDGTGAPVKAEVAVALVDEAVWSLARVELADIYETYYRPRNLSVETSNLISVSMDRINANMNLGSKGGSGGGCFAGETLILMSDGSYKPISEVAAGDFVLTREGEDSDKLVTARVRRLLIHDVTGYLIINGNLRVTAVHRMFSRRGWVTAGKLRKGDELLDSNNRWVTVESIQEMNEQVRVYNLEVEEFRTYFAANVWVHNQKGEGFATSREKFLDTAYWEAHLMTDEKGNAEIKVKLPDNLTTWRLLGVATTKDTAVGDGMTKVLVTKDVLIQPMLPRFLSIGDKPQVGMVIHNNSRQDQSVRMQIQAEGLKILENTTQEMMIPAAGSRKAYWNSDVIGEREAVVTLSAVGSGNLADSVKLKLPIVSYYTPEVMATAGEAADVGEEKIFLPTDVVPDKGMLKINLSPSIGAGVGEAASYLLSFPYWCSEQIISRITSALNLLDLADTSGTSDFGGYTQDDLRKMVEDGIQRLVKSQGLDGGWGWWITYSSDAMLSAMVMDGLLEAKEHNFSVPDQTIERGLGYLTLQISYGEQVPENGAYNASVLAKGKRIDGGTLSRLMDRRWEMSLTGRAYLLLALQRSGKSRRDERRLMDEIVSLVQKSGTTAHWEESDRQRRLLMSGNATLTSLILEALVTQDPRHPLVSESVRWLMKARQGGHWMGTRDTAAALRAISKAIIKREEKKADFRWILEMGGVRIGDGQFGKDNLRSEVLKEIAVSEIKKGIEVPIKIQKSGKGNLYYNLDLSYFLPFEEVKALDQGIVVIRELVDRNGRNITSDRVKAGQDIWVRLILVTPNERHHLVVEDTLPAGFEPVNESLATTALLNVERLQVPKDREELYFRHVEMRDDRVAMFAEYIPAGVYEYTYRVRPATPGDYHYPPANAYEMYLPDVSGHSAGGWIRVEE